MPWVPSFYAELEAPDSDSRNGFDVIEEHFGGLGGGFSGSIVFRSESGVDDPQVREAMEAMFREVDSYEGVSVTSPYLATIPIPETPRGRTPHMPGRPQVSVDGQVAFARLDLGPELDFNDTSRLGGEFVVASQQVVSQAGRRSPQGDLLPTTVPMQVDVRDHRIILHEVMTNVEEDDGGQRERGRVGTAPQAGIGS